MLGKILLLSLFLSYTVYMESEASYLPFFEEPSSNVNSANKAKASNTNDKTIVVGNGGGGGNYPIPCDNGGFYGIATSFFVGAPCPYG